MPVIMLMLVIIYAVTAYWLRQKVRQFLYDHQLLKPNYKGQPIPVGFGLYLWMTALLFGLLQQAWLHAFGWGADLRELFLYLLLGYSIVFMLGWLDDTIGWSEPKGLTGHVKAWLIDGMWTTGFLKAAGIGLAAIGASLFLHASWWMMVVHMLLISLSSNFMNLLDVRPGRAMKGFWLLAAVLLAAACVPGSGKPLMLWMILLPFMIGTAFLFSLDVKAQGMLGDAGANLLGFALGCGAAAAAPVWFQLMLLFLLILLHWYAEHRSLTEAIEKIQWLRGIDRWGRV